MKRKWYLMAMAVFAAACILTFGTVSAFAQEEPPVLTQETAEEPLEEDLLEPQEENSVFTQEQEAADDSAELEGDLMALPELGEEENLSVSPLETVQPETSVMSAGVEPVAVAYAAGEPAAQSTTLAVKDVSALQNLNGVSEPVVLIKATQGSETVQTNWKSLTDQALTLGKLTALVHGGYTSTADDSNAEACHFYNTVKSYVGKTVFVLNADQVKTQGSVWIEEFLDTFYYMSGVKCLVQCSVNPGYYDWTEIRSSGYSLWSDTVTSAGYSGTTQTWKETAAPSAAGSGGCQPLYRLYNRFSGEHLFTLDTNERNVLRKRTEWVYEGIAWMTPVTGKDIYRLYNRNTGEHLYTLDKNEVNVLTRLSWVYEGIAYKSKVNGDSVMRLYNPHMYAVNHHYTMDQNEYKVLQTLGWNGEGIAFYGKKLFRSVRSSSYIQTINGAKYVFTASGYRISGSTTIGNTVYKTDSTGKVTSETPVTLSWLHTDGTKIKDADGNVVVLKGISTHGLSWFPEYVNDACFAQIKNEWNANTVRLALYTAEYNGYCTGGNQTELLNLIDQGVNLAKKYGLYVIIDWHILSDGNPLTNMAQAKTFFDTVSKKYKNDSNVLYEICNEPNGGTTWQNVKTYANTIIPIIRKNSPKSLILVGSPTWSQDVDQAAASPLTYSNVVYTLHFYAATHKEDLRKKAQKALDAGIPLLVSEFSICDASGNGSLDYDSANKWMEFLKKNDIGFVAWSLCNKAESASLIKSTVKKTSGFTQSDLSPTGVWLMNALAGKITGSSSSQTQTSTETPTAAVLNITGSKLVKVGTGWQSGGYTYQQYEVNVTNNTSTKALSWKTAVTLDGTGWTIDQSWNGVYSISGTTLTISNVDYNGTLEPGQSTNVGFILKKKS